MQKRWCPVPPPDVQVLDPVKVAVMRDPGARVDELLEDHVKACAPWWPSEILPGAQRPEADPERGLLRDRARGIPEAVKVALALNDA